MLVSLMGILKLHNIKKFDSLSFEMEKEVLMFTIITENDESQWNDETGVLYHFPKRYLKYLQPGTQVIYYKGRIKSSIFKNTRLSPEPHYFAKAKIHSVYPDPESIKDNSFYAIVCEYVPFVEPVMAKISGEYLEEIPLSRATNYWRDGVRVIGKAIFDNILARVEYYAVLQNEAKYEQINSISNIADVDLESAKEGQPSLRFVTTYERSPVYRKAALLIHGTRCKACGFEYGNFYGDYAKGFIHVHHVNPVSQVKVPMAINPATDLVPLCANCHSVIHRRKDKTLTIDELKGLIKNNVNV